VSTCFWLNNTYLSIRSSSSSYVQPLDTIRLQATTIVGVYSLHAYCIEPSGDCRAYVACGTKSSVSIKYPQSPLTPTPSLLVPSSIGICDNLVLDYSLSIGHGGRVWKNRYWVVSSSDGSSVADILTLLQASPLSSSEGTVTIPVSVFENTHLTTMESFSNVTLASSTTYIISMGLENYLQQLSTSQVFYQTKSVTIDRSSNAPPSVTIIGKSNRIVVEGGSVRLNAKGSVSTCVNTSSSTATATTTSRNKLTYSWSVYSDFVLLSSISAKNTAVNPTYFTLPKNAMSSGKTYQVVVTATDSYSIKSTDFVTIFIQPKPVTVHVPGGVKRLVAAQEELSLTVDGSASLLTFTWSCVYQTLSTKYGTSCLSLVEHCNIITTDAASATCVISATYVTVYDVLLFTAIATSSSSGQTGSAQIVVTVTRPIKSAQAILYSSYDGDKFNTNNKLQLNCSISGQLTSVVANWSLVGDDFLALDDIGVALTRTHRSFQFTASSQSTVQVT
jgi:hypothetical protein